MKSSIKEIKNELAILGNRTQQMEERIGDIKYKNLEMMKMEEQRDLKVKKNEKTL